MSKQPPPAPTASAVGPCPTVIKIVGRPGTGSSHSTFAPPDHPRSTLKIRQNGGWEARRFADFFDWNTHFVVFSGGFEQGLGGPTARSSWKIRQNGGWETRRLDPAGMIITPAAPGTRADEGGGPSHGFLYGCFFYLKWRWALIQEITD